MSAKWRMVLWFTLMMLLLAGVTLTFVLVMNGSVIANPTSQVVREVSRRADDIEFDNGTFDWDDMKEYKHGVYCTYYDAGGTYLRGAMLGYTRKFMDEMYEQIMQFSELKEFEDRPFKQLSSGMKSRLAFSIASLVQPDILILDEVLSVGDGAFRKKSEAKMREILASGATTILVSHSITQVRQLCSKILWLHKGRQIEFGDDVQQICDRYEAFLAGKLKL